MYDMYGEVCFSQKNVYKWAKHGSKRWSMEWKRTDPLVKKKYRARKSVKNLMLTVFCDIKGPIRIDFLEKGAAVNSASYCQLLWQNSSYLFNDSHLLEMQPSFTYMAKK